MLSLDQRDDAGARRNIAADSPTREDLALRADGVRNPNQGFISPGDFVLRLNSGIARHGYSILPFTPILPFDRLSRPRTSLMGATGRLSAWGARSVAEPMRHALSKASASVRKT